MLGQGLEYLFSQKFLEIIQKRVIENSAFFFGIGIIFIFLILLHFVYKRYRNPKKEKEGLRMSFGVLFDMVYEKVFGFFEDIIGA